MMEGWLPRARMAPPSLAFLVRSLSRAYQSVVTLRTAMPRFPNERSKVIWAIKINGYPRFVRGNLHDRTSLEKI
jgi:hypothetical protein